MFHKLLVLLITAFLSTSCATIPAQASAEKTITLRTDNTVFLRGKVTFGSMNKLSHEIMNHPKDKLNLFISSPGGSVFAGLDLINTMKASGKEITCIADVAISMAFVILQQCDKRYVTENAVAMQHQMSYGLRGTEGANWNLAVFLRTVAKKIQKMDYTRIGLKKSEYKERVDHDWWLFDSNIVKSNAADKVVNIRCSKKMINSYDTVKQQTLFFTAEYQISKCPLLKGPIKKKGTLHENTKQAKQKMQMFFLKADNSYWASRIRTKLERPPLTWNRY